MNSWSQLQGGQNRIWMEEINANRFFWDSLWLEIWKNHLCPPMGPNRGSMAMDSGKTTYVMSLYGTEWRERGYGLWNNNLCTYVLYGPVHNVFDACRYITRASGRALDPGCREFLGPVK